MTRKRRSALWDRFEVYWLGSTYGVGHGEHGYTEMIIALRPKVDNDPFAEQFHKDLTALVPMPVLHPTYRNGSMVISDPDGMERTVQRHWKGKR